MKLLWVSEEHPHMGLYSLLSNSGFLIEAQNPLAGLTEFLEEAYYDAVLYDADSEKAIARCHEMLRMFNRQGRREGVIVLSSSPGMDLKIASFDLGADDYVVKPYEAVEVLARLKAVVKRKIFNTRDKIYFANLMIDPDANRVYVWDRQLKLTVKEYEILLYFIAHKGTVLTKESLGRYLWSNYLDRSDSFDFLFSHIKNLKRKLKEAKAELVIKNLYGVGYLIEEI